MSYNKQINNSQVQTYSYVMQSFLVHHIFIDTFHIIHFQWFNSRALCSTFSASPPQLSIDLVTFLLTLHCAEIEKNIIVYCLQYLTQDSCSQLLCGSQAAHHIHAAFVRMHFTIWCRLSFCFSSAAPVGLHHITQIPSKVEICDII